MVVRRRLLWVFSKLMWMVHRLWMVTRCWEWEWSFVMLKEVWLLPLEKLCLCTIRLNGLSSLLWSREFFWLGKWLSSWPSLNPMLPFSFKPFLRTSMVVNLATWSKGFNLRNQTSWVAFFDMWKGTPIGLLMSLPNMQNVIMSVVFGKVFLRLS